jgi:hypothetical protein
MAVLGVLLVLRSMAAERRRKPGPVGAMSALRLAGGRGGPVIHERCE